MCVLFVLPHVHTVVLRTCIYATVLAYQYQKNFTLRPLPKTFTIHENYYEVHISNLQHTNFPQYTLIVSHSLHSLTNYTMSTTFHFSLSLPHNLLLSYNKVESIMHNCSPLPYGAHSCLMYLNIRSPIFSHSPVIN